MEAMPVSTYIIRLYTCNKCTDSEMFAFLSSHGDCSTPRQNSDEVWSISTLRDTFSNLETTPRRSTSGVWHGAGLQSTIGYVCHLCLHHVVA